MIYSIQGTVERAKDGFVVVQTAAGVGYKIFTNQRILRRASAGNVVFFCHLRVSETALDLYGFFDEAELGFFEMLLSVSGVGPKSALAITDVAELPQLKSAIAEGRPDLLCRASGIGQKTASRIVLELRGKIEATASQETVERMDSDSDVIDALVSLGYRREEAKEALKHVGNDIAGVEQRIKAALRILGKH